MNIALWVVQVLLAVVFFAAGALKASRPLGQLAKRMEWVKAVPPAAVRLLGVAEVLGALGLVLPVATGILPWLTPIAAIGLTVVMVGATVHHASHHEYPATALNVVLLLFTVFVAYGRFVAVPV